MPEPVPQRFHATLQSLDDALGWVIAWVPFDVPATWPTMIRRRVTVEVAGQTFRTSLFSANSLQVPEARKRALGLIPEAGKRGAGKPPPPGRGHFFVVNKKMQHAASAGVGASIDFTMAPDLAPREAPIPPDLLRVIRGEKALLKWYPTLSDSIRREIGKWIESVDAPEARHRRAESMAERLLLTMEGEKILPPILEVAFRRTPAARAGWDGMTPAQRRGSLLAIFYYATPEARDRRTTKVIEDCLKRKPVQ